MGVDNANIITYFANDRIELVNFLELYNVYDVMANSYHLYDVGEYETNDHNYFDILQNEYLVMLEVGALWLINQYRRDLPMATVDDGAFTTIDDCINVNMNTKNNHSNNLKGIWLGDSGASCHMTCDEDGMYDCREIKSPIKIGDGRTLYATKIGKKKLMVIQKDGTTLDVVLDECKFVPGLWINLFSITKALGNKWNISNKGQCLILSKNNVSIEFDRIMKTDNGAVVGVLMKPRIDKMNVSMEKGRVVDINDFHNAIGHINEDSLIKTAAFYGIKLKGKFKTCYECSISKN